MAARIVHESCVTISLRPKTAGETVQSRKSEQELPPDENNMVTMCMTIVHGSRHDLLIIILN